MRQARTATPLPCPIFHQTAHRGHSLPGSPPNAPPFARVEKKEHNGRLLYGTSSASESLATGARKARTAAHLQLG